MGIVPPALTMAHLHKDHLQRVKRRAERTTVEYRKKAASYKLGKAKVTAKLRALADKTKEYMSLGCHEMWAEDAREAMGRYAASLEQQADAAGAAQAGREDVRMRREALQARREQEEVLRRQRSDERDAARLQRVATQEQAHTRKVAERERKERERATAAKKKADDKEAAEARKVEARASAAARQQEKRTAAAQKPSKKRQFGQQSTSSGSSKKRTCGGHGTSEEDESVTWVYCNACSAWRIVDDKPTTRKWTCEVAGRVCDGIDDVDE